MKRTLYIILFTLAVPLCFAQSGSPSSRYGYGEMMDNVPNELRAMGGVMTGMRSNHTINPSQPASYTAGDSLSFMFDVAASVGWTNYHDAYGQKNLPLGALEYVTMQFPLWKRWIAFSCGIVPYSMVKYDFTLSGSTGDYDYTVKYTGDGGLSEVYAGLGFNILDWFAAGANFYYVFGTTTNNTLLSFTSATINNTDMLRYMDLSAFRTKVGAQFFHTFAKKHTVTLGATFDPKLPMGGKYYIMEVTSLDTLPPMSKCETPMAWSVGASYIFNRQITIAADYSFQNWSDAYYYDQKNILQDRHRISMGLQYQHNLYGMKYRDRMIWRLGAAVMNSYTTGSNWQDFSVSMGFGFPLRTSASVVNTTVEYCRKSSLSGMIEHNTRFIVDVAINEKWFHKRKL